jgi:predicted CoA-binding protein
MEVVAVLGASNDSSRYAYKAMRMLNEYGHKPVPVHPREKEVLGLPVYSSLGELAKSGQKVDTVTVYVNKEVSQKYEADFLALRPRRVIFNPGAENGSLEKVLSDNGIIVDNACTLVLLRSEQF